MDDLRLKLERQGLENVTYMVVNHQGEPSQRLHLLLQEKFSQNISLYRQLPGQPDVWEALNGEKDDFLIYDRCGRLTYHISLPDSNLSTPYVAEAIRETYCRSVCGSCKLETPEQLPACNRTVEKEPEHHGHGHHHKHGHKHKADHSSAERGGHGVGGQHQHAHHHTSTEHGHTHHHHAHQVHQEGAIEHP